MQLKPWRPPPLFLVSSLDLYSHHIICWRSLSLDGVTKSWDSWFGGHDSSFEKTGDALGRASDCRTDKLCLLNCIWAGESTLTTVVPVPCGTFSLLCSMIGLGDIILVHTNHVFLWGKKKPMGKSTQECSCNMGFATEEAKCLQKQLINSIFLEMWQSWN